VAVAWARRGGRVLLERPAENGPLRGRWDLPAIEVAPGADAAVALRSRMARRGLTVDVGPPVARLRHAVMNRRLEIEVLRCRVSRGRVAGRADLRWVEPEDLPTTAVSGATLKTARAAGAIPPDGRGPRIGALARRPGPP
jgi:adenine-specific DNA glycosylase